MVNGPQRMAPKPLAVMKDTSSSSGKVFAKPSKEWVVPERTKPGRKISAEEPDNKRQSQNRLSQRAHRARRTDYITTLEERLRQYEADEIHSNVRLQEVARALKADNERLKKENAEIKAESEVIQRENGAFRAQLEGTSTGRRLSSGRESQSSTPRPSTSRATSHRQSNHRPTIACPICPDPDPDCPCQNPSATLSSASLSSAPLATLSLAAKALEDHDHGPSPSSGIESKITLTDSSCGVCRSDDECLCRVLREEEAKESTGRVLEVQEVNTTTDGCGLCTSAAFCACKVEVESPKQSTSTGAVSLSLKRSRVSSGPKAKVWDFTSSTLDNGSTPSAPETVACSGDPSNCQACKDDSFGQEFCTNLYSNLSIARPCDDCPGNCMSISSLLNDDAMRAREGSTPMERERTMTPDRAWRALKAHPNSKLASLSLLADVVARHTKCIGYDEAPQSSSTSTTAPPSNNGHVPSPARHGPSITPNISGRGFRRRLEVETSGLRDALKVLDGIAPGTPSSMDGSSPKRRKVELANDW